MKSNTMKTNNYVSETRKIRKPLMEKKRRARINDSLEILKEILLESKSAAKEPVCKKGQKTAKLEKADILEMTVQYIQNLRKKLDEEKPPQAAVKEEILIRAADSSSDPVKQGLINGLTLVPARLINGELAFIIPPINNCAVEKKSASDSMWRPW